MHFAEQFVRLQTDETIRALLYMALDSIDSMVQFPELELTEAELRIIERAAESYFRPDYVAVTLSRFDLIEGMEPFDVFQSNYFLCHRISSTVAQSDTDSDWGGTDNPAMRTARGLLNKISAELGPAGNVADNLILLSTDERLMPVHSPREGQNSWHDGHHELRTIPSEISDQPFIVCKWDGIEQHGAIMSLIRLMWVDMLICENTIRHMVDGNS